ncbi:MAG: D-aminoacyl-tRNA deacylase [Myxococcota bacterium]|nr:D-aminoacyl-tRNA deacylase [Myxococcota bacterium]HIL99801.1 D-tyrosyl-tRNA(Tyr) deacylase [Myxococcales bacterium]
MRAVVQRVREAKVEVGAEVVADIGPGLLVLVGVGGEDGSGDAAELARRIVHLRIFPDDEGKMNLSVLDTGGAVALVSQFTLFGDARKGRRPYFGGAAAPEIAAPLIDKVAGAIRSLGVDVQCGRFQTHMQVSLTNDGPVTILLDTQKSF